MKGRLEPGVMGFCWFLDWEGVPDMRKLFSTNISGKIGYPPTDVGGGVPILFAFVSSSNELDATLAFGPIEMHLFLWQHAGLLSAQVCSLTPWL